MVEERPSGELPLPGRSDPGILGMDPQEMRRLGYKVVDLLVERWRSLPDAPAFRSAVRSDTESLLREPAPEEGQSPDAVIERAVEDVLQLAGRIDHPRFVAFIPSSPTWPGVLADFLVAGYNPFQGTWLESAGPSQVELVVIEWFCQWIGLPEGSGGVFTSGGSAANLGALVAARERAGHPADAVIYVSDQGHSSMERAARIAGIRPAGIEKIPVDEDFRMDVEELARRLELNRAAGRAALLVCANAGATNTGVVDTLAPIAELARRYHAWYHVDAAYGGFASLVPEGLAELKGIEQADSVTLDPHKWLFQPYEAGCLLVRDPTSLEDAFAVTPEYLQDTELGMEQINFANRSLQLSRSFKALKVWMSIQTLGLGRFREAIQAALDQAKRAHGYVSLSSVLEPLAPASLGVVCFRYVGKVSSWDPKALEGINVAIQASLIKDGFAMMSSTRLHGVYSLRICAMNHRTTWEDIEAILQRVEEAGNELCAAP